MAADLVEIAMFDAPDADLAAAAPTTMSEFEQPVESAEVALFAATSQLVPVDATDGRTRISFRDEPFANLAGGFSGVRYVKGHILLSDPGTVYFQDSVQYLYHYDFATARLAPFLNMTHDQFDAVSLRQTGQQVVMVNVLMPSDGQELAVQVVGYDAYAREDVAAWIHAVASSVDSDVPLTLLYMPTYEQSAAAAADRAWFETQGIVVADPSRWQRGDVTYADGWATGRLVRVPAAQITAAYGDGRLRPTDILLLTDGVPAEVPYVRGIVSLVPATPNSHVAILARNQQIPFAWVQNPAEQQRLVALAGHAILLRADSGSIVVSPLDEPLAPTGVADWLDALQTPAPAQVTPKATYGDWLTDATDLTPADIRYFGGKAANYGLLMRTIPDNAQRAMAFSFDLWDAFMSNVHPTTGRTLREEIALRLGSFSYPPDMTVARQKLAEVNTLIRKTVKWTDAQRTQILNELIVGFPDVPHDQFLRFRSSSNAEDSQELTGAGLYDSYSGCIADDTDGDSVGPSRADPNEPDEKGVFRAIEKVFASFYNENAWLERLRHGVREQDTGMAILVHHNFPDSLEMANGVVTLTYRRSEYEGSPTPGYSASIVTQLGALSVTNPEGGAIAEEVQAYQSAGQDPYVYVKTSSTLVPLGTTVMDWQTDYPELMRLVSQVADGYADLYPNKDEFTLDLEFKRMIPGKLVVKQVREIPMHETAMVRPQLLNESTEWRVLQSEFTDVWAHHRLKSQLSMSTINGAIDANSNPIKQLDLTLLAGDGATPIELAGAPASLPGYEFTGSDGQFATGFTLGRGVDQREYSLTTQYPVQVDQNRSPVITPRDFMQELEVRYSRPVPTLVGSTSSARYVDRVQLVPAGQLTPAAAVQTRSWTFGDVQVVTRFHWAAVGDNMIVKTMPLAAWVDTVITGLTTEPIRLTGDAAQTYAPGHHNFSEQFVFEPGLERSLTAQQRAELSEKNVQLLHVFHNAIASGLPGDSSDRLTILGLDGVFRSASEITLPEINLDVGRAVRLVAAGYDDQGRRVIFRNPTWEVDGGGTATRHGTLWTFTATQPGKWELVATDPQHPGIQARATVLIAGVAVDDGGVLHVVGRASSDKIALEQVDSSTIRVRADFLRGANRVQTFTTDQFYRVEVHGGAGRDTLSAVGLDLPVTMDGGDGDDLLRGGDGDDLLAGGRGADKIWGGAGADVLLGGEGNDVLRGEAGRNLLIGGDGRDQLFGGPDEDILIGGETTFSRSWAESIVNSWALRSILDEWTTSRTAGERQANLSGLGGNAERRNDEVFLIWGATVFDDGRHDSILRPNRRHWLVAR